jgi:hypothetical protein
VAAPVAAPRLAQRRRSPKLIALAVAMVAVGALVAAYAVTLVGSSRHYLAVAQPVAVGAEITAADLTIVRLTTDPALSPIPAGDAGRVVGRYAAVNLVPGTLLVADHLTDEPVPGPGQSLVPVGLREDRQPVGHLTPGTAVRLVAVPSSGGGGDEPRDLPIFDATVVDVRSPESRTGGTTVVVNVAVADDDAPAVAALAATNRLMILVRGG